MAEHLTLGPGASKILGRNAWRTTPATMAVRLSKGQWIAARHLQFISSRIAQRLRRGNARLIICMPPRHGKTELLAKWTPVWEFDWDPSHEVMLTCYGAELATDSGRVVRDRMLMYKDLLRTHLRDDKQQTGHFLTTGGGGMLAVGIGGSVTGRGANTLLIDDYIKNIAEAESLTQRDKQWDWFLSTAYTRLEPNANVVILATRWNIDDIIGRIELEHPDDWEIIRLPAIAEENDPLGRAVGEALWPERYSLEALINIKRVLGTYFWEALYQQKPIPRTTGLEGGVWDQPLDIFPKEHLKYVRAWDLAGTAGGGDYTVGMLLGEDSHFGFTYILDVIREQLSPGAVEMLVQRTAMADGHAVPIMMEQEPGASGKSLISHYARNVVKGYAFRGERATGSALVRANPVLALAEAGGLRMVRARWNKTLIEEVRSFPDGPHDDQVIALALAYNHLTSGLRGKVVWGRKPNAADQARMAAAGGNINKSLTWGRR